MKNTKIIILISIILIALVSWFVINKNNNIITEETNENSKLQTNTEYTTLEFPENNLNTSDWEIYRNEEYGFETKYPKDWSIYLLKKGDLLGIVNEDDSGIEFKKNNSSVGIRIFFSDESFFLVRQRKIEWIQKEEGGFYKDLIKNGIKGILIEKNKENIFGQKDYIFGNEKQTLTFTNVREDLIFQQILLSFKLIQ